MEVHSRGVILLFEMGKNSVQLRMSFKIPFQLWSDVFLLPHIFSNAMIRVMILVKKQEKWNEISKPDVFVGGFWNHDFYTYFLSCQIGNHAQSPSFGVNIKKLLRNRFFCWPLFLWYPLDIHMCHGQKSAILGMVIPPLIGILIMGI